VVGFDGKTSPSSSRIGTAERIVDGRRKEMKKVHIYYSISGDDWIELELEDDETPEDALREEAPLPLDVEHEILEVVKDEDWEKKV